MWRSIGDRLARDPRVAWALFSATAAVSSLAALRDVFLNNEGIFTYLFAGMIADDPIPVAFFLKGRPPIAALYALPAALGYDAFVVAHALVASASVPLTAALARAVGQERPNVAAALVACSAMAIASGASGVGNSDAMTLSVLVCALIFAWDRPALAGVVAAALPLARAETVLLVAPIAVHLLRAGGTARWRFLLGIAGPALAYTIAGAIYHHDVLWFVHHPPHVTERDPYSVVMGRRMFGGAPHQAALTLLTLTPSVGLIAFARWSKLSPVERTLAVFLGLFLGILMVLPGLAPLNFGDMPRYVLPSVPFLALLAGRASESLAGAEAPPARSWIAAMAILAAILVVGHVQDARHASPALLWGVAGWSSIALASATRARPAVPALVVALALAACPPLLPATRLALRDDTVMIGRYVLAEAEPGTTVLTNIGELPLWLARHGGAGLDVRHLMAADQRFELDALANESVGQRSALHALLRRHWYGTPVFAEDVRASLEPGVWLALRPDARTQHVLDERWLEGRSETIELEHRYRVVRVVAP